MRIFDIHYCESGIQRIFIYFFFFLVTLVYDPSSSFSSITLELYCIYIRVEIWTSVRRFICVFSGGDLMWMLPYCCCYFECLNVARVTLCQYNYFVTRFSGLRVIGSVSMEGKKKKKLFLFIMNVHFVCVCLRMAGLGIWFVLYMSIYVVASPYASIYRRERVIIIFGWSFFFSSVKDNECISNIRHTATRMRSLIIKIMWLLARKMNAKCNLRVSVWCNHTIRFRLSFGLWDSQKIQNLSHLEIWLRCICTFYKRFSVVSYIGFVKVL